MKKIIPILMISLLVIGTTILWITHTQFPMPVFEIGPFVILFAMVGFALYIAINRYRSVRRGEPAEDELSKRILQKASSMAYYVSLYLWVGMIFVNDRIDIGTEVLLGAGILGMAVIWAIFIVYFKIKGLKDA